MDEPVPAQPAETNWRFVAELQAPLHRHVAWTDRRARPGEVDLRGGVEFVPTFPDPQGRLQTAWEDFRRFLNAGGVASPGGWPIRAVHGRTPCFEAFRIDVRPGGCRIVAGDTEGIRRGLVHLEDEMLRCGGPVLPVGRVVRRPAIRTRISRCFFGPIKRPPKNRDELADDTDYYPDEYLNRLAHDGVNGLWLTVAFRDLCRTRAIPEFGHDADRRLDKLRRTVAKCARYGIRIYVFCIEPAALSADSPILKRHPGLAGHPVGDLRSFCTQSALAKRYLEEATFFLFDRVPGLGGLIDISVGERLTHCCSGQIARSANTCPRCARREPWEVLAGVLTAMERGMHRASPDAELISWPYSQYICWGEALTRKAAGHVPPGVILQHNFESTARARQLGKERILSDYWLSHVGPSALYRDCARRARRAGTRMSAKLQVGCSHEVATAPWVPVPGILYRKYLAMRDLGVSAAMQCWYFGNYPSVMTKAAGKLSIGPMPGTEEEFLRDLARREWGRHAQAVVRAWKRFGRAYQNYPHSHVVGYYGPMHDGPVWPLYLEPRDLPLAPTWLLQYPPSGDRIGEFITETHTVREMRILFSRMVRHWDRGVAILKRLRPAFARQPERLRDIGVATALGLQFQSGRNILEFYALREELPSLLKRQQQAALRTLKGLVGDELRIDKELLRLCRADSTLGFHSEAEGYKYHPAKIAWRMRQLRRLLRTEFPRVEAQVRKGEAIFPEYTGARPRGTVYVARRVAKAPAMNGRPVGGVWDLAETAECRFRSELHSAIAGPLSDSEWDEYATTWKAVVFRKRIYVGIVCNEPRMGGLADGLSDRHDRYFWENDCAGVMIEPRRLWPCVTCTVNPRGSRSERHVHGPASYRWQGAAEKETRQWSVTLSIPLSMLRRGGDAERPLRIDVFRCFPAGRNEGRRVCHHWMPRRPLPYRLLYNTDNPADLGWLVLERSGVQHP